MIEHIKKILKENQNYIIKETSWRVIVLLPILATLNYINLELYGFFASFFLIFILFILRKKYNFVSLSNQGFIYSICLITILFIYKFNHYISLSML